MLRVLDRHRVAFVLIGGVAARLHGQGEAVVVERADRLAEGVAFLGVVQCPAEGGLGLGASGDGDAEAFP